MYSIYIFFFLKTEFQWSSKQDWHLLATAISVNTLKDCYSLAPFPHGRTSLSMSAFHQEDSCRRGQSHLQCVISCLPFTTPVPFHTWPWHGDILWVPLHATKTQHYLPHFQEHCRLSLWSNVTSEEQHIWHNCKLFIPAIYRDQTDNTCRKMTGKGVCVFF